MIFHSIEFIILLVVTFLLYYLPIFKRLQVIILIVSSFIFYGFYNPLLLILFVICILVNAMSSYEIQQSHNLAKQKVLLISSIVFNLLLLCFFKYGAGVAGFWVTSSLNTNNSFFNYLLLMPLPIGISFYTFEGISLLVDVYKNKQAIAQKKQTNFARHLLNTSFFISFFPHLISGPILKAHSFFPQIEHKKWSNINWEGVLHHLVIGFFLKMVVADNLKDLNNIISFPYFQAYSTYSLLFAVFGFSIEIFADFAGYSLIAVGLGQLFGYSLPHNFNFPYIATSFSDFWQRWHISLSAWLKEYVYIPLGGNRLGSSIIYRNLMIVMTLGGLWHGCSWTYALWGGIHGVFLVLEKKYSFRLPLAGRLFKWLFVFIFVSFLWVLFKLPDIHHIWLFLKTLLKNIHLPIIKLGNQFEIFIYSIPVIAYHLRHLLVQSLAINTYIKKFIFLRPMVYGVLLFLIIVNSGDAGKFIYFQF